MPIYEYRCRKCGEEFEVMQKITEDPLKKCINCGGRVDRLISNTTFILKGTGWYATDYAKKDTGGEKGRRERAGEDSSGQKKSDSGDSAVAPAK